MIKTNINNNFLCQTLNLNQFINSTTSPTKKAYRFNNILQLLDICKSTIHNEELSINIIISNEKRNTDHFTKTPYFKPTFKISHYTVEQQKFLTLLIFQHSQITQNEFEKLADLIINYPTFRTPRIL